MQVCARCHYLNERRAPNCIQCKSDMLTKSFSNIIGLIDPANSYVAKVLAKRRGLPQDEYMRPGFYALSIESDEEEDIEQ